MDMGFKNKNSKKIGVIIGYIIMILIFSTSFYYLLIILEKLPNSCNYFHVLLTLTSIIFIGKIIKGWLSQN